jgi:predicted anti-sigma-YlaC factor YlaD
MSRCIRWTSLLALAALASLPACSIKKIAVNSLGNALAEGGSSYAKDDDPDLVWEAVPFGLKSIEALLDESPRHRGLLLAATSGFTQYAYGHLQQDADFVESDSFARATYLRDRAKKLYLRALDYGFRGLEVDFPGLRQRLRADPQAALAKTRKSHVGLLYWTGIAWFAAIGIAKDDSSLTADQDLAEALMRRSLALDESFEHGSIHEFFISWEGRPESVGGSPAKAREHLERALQVSKERSAWALVNYAEKVSVPKQARAEFQQLLERALAVDPNAYLPLRLSNILAQRRARWLLGRTEDLFLE